MPATSDDLDAVAEQVAISDTGGAQRRASTSPTPRSTWRATRPGYVNGHTLVVDCGRSDQRWLPPLRHPGGRRDRHTRPRRASPRARAARSALAAGRAQGSTASAPPWASPPSSPPPLRFDGSPALARARAWAPPWRFALSSPPPLALRRLTRLGRSTGLPRPRRHLGASPPSSPPPLALRRLARPWPRAGFRRDLGDSSESACSLRLLPTLAGEGRGTPGDGDPR